MRQIMIEICDGHLRPSQVKQRRESIFSALYEGEWLTHQLVAEERVFGEPFLTENLIPMIVERMDQLPVLQQVPAGVLEKAAAKDSSALEKAAAKDSSAQEKAAKDSSAQEKAAKDSSAQQKAAKDSSAQEFAVKDPEFVAKDSSAQEFAAKDSSAQEFAEPADAAGNETGNEIAGDDETSKGDAGEK